MKARIPLLFTVVLMAVASCIDEYWPELGKYENLLVVDGTLTDVSGPYTIRLSLSSDMDRPVFIPHPGCVVSIRDDEGYVEQLEEQGPGIYRTSADGIRGVIGRKYQLSITSPDGKTYESPFEELLPKVGLDTVYAAIEYRQTATLYHDLVGYQFYLDTYRAQSDSTYYLWQLEETYEYHSDFFIDYTYSGSIESFSNRDTLFYCWRTENVYEVFTANTLNLTEPVLTGFPLHYVDTETRKLSVLYSLLVRQFTISAAAHSFWDDIRNVSIKEGSLYAQQPFQITGNVYNTSDNQEPVLGYFLVAGVDEKRYFFSKPLDVYFYYSVCELNTDLRSLAFYPRSMWPIYMTQDQDGKMGFASEGCFDCTFHHGSLEKPDFWTY